MTKGDSGVPQGAHPTSPKHNLRMYVSRLKIGGHRKGDKERNDALSPQPVNARLNALFNSQSGATHIHSDPGQPLSRAMSSPTPLSTATNAPPVITVQGPDLPQASTPLYLKVRIVTWNMNDSVPKGDLSELLGRVPLYKHHGHDIDRLRLPDLTLESGHPYHLVVVAGQECPTLSGIPRGIGAFKMQDKERELREREKLKEKEAKRKEKRMQRLLKNLGESASESSEDESSSLHPSISKGAKEHHTAGGWTSILEDWLSAGIGAVPGARPVVSQSDFSPALSPTAGQPLSSPLPREGEGNPWDMPPHKKGRGPYELVSKERLMGLYLAIYIHRDVRPLMKGLSKSTVTAGLIGGRVGNKGGIGVSLNLNGTRLLFINAHLAAHGDKAHLRLANLQKIKAELTVETFLKPDDPRNMAEDISDRFDHTFLFGDLNYRLDISRLHADWLISRKDYATALKFDQLIKEMENGTTFSGFHEAPINFPPTFKYDVLKTLKRRKRQKKGKNGAKNSGDMIAEEDDGYLTATDAEGHRRGDHSDDASPGGSDVETDASSAWTSRTRMAVLDDDSEQMLSPGSDQSSPAVVQLRELAHKAVHKAKRSFVDVVAPVGSPMRARMSMRERMDRQRGDIYGASGTDGSPAKSESALGRSKSLQVPHSTDHLTASEQDLSHPQPHTKPRPRHERKASDSSDDWPPSKNDYAVYDTSHKQRVPSWCDRVLWKSTVVPDPEPEVAHHHDSMRGRPILGGIFSRFNRKRRESESSMSSMTGSSGHQLDMRATPESDQVLTQSPVVSTPDGPSPNSSPRAQSPTRNRIWNFQRQMAGKRSLSSSSSMEDIAREKRATHKPRQVSLPVVPVYPSPLGVDTGAHPKPSTSQSQPNPATSPVVPKPTPRSITLPPLPPLRPLSPPKLPLTLPPPLSPPVLPTSPPPPVSPPPPTLPPRPHTPPHATRFQRIFSWALPAIDSTPVFQPDLTEPPPPVSQYRKGDVLCVGYTSLDDRSMRRLEGRSDHRPVIAEYALFL